ncbi:MAG TPA: NAD(P)/FAD-dependent oxidoreductase [Candidatus Acidoferrales bacterium]|nr:NAD(P)/FAD-dependent oxidoreductase [Candidatus Acidoferrales bacterium]
MPAGQNVVIVGGGHNALVAAFYLARGGFKPLVLERRDVIGGAAVTEEFHPGFKGPTLAHTVGPLRADVARDMQLEKFGFELIRPDPRVFAPAPGGQALLFYDDHARTAESIAKFSPADARNYPEFARTLERIAQVFAQVVSITPPSIDHPSPDALWNLFKVGRGFRGLGKKEMFRLLRWGPMAVADLVAEFFETELLRAVIAARGIFGTAMGPWSAGSSAVLLLRSAADPHPVGSAAYPRGGMGALTRALAESAQRAGVEIRTESEVAEICVKDGEVSAVLLVDGTEIPATAVVSGADPQRTFLRMVDPVHFDPDFLMKVQHYRTSGTSAKINLALSGLPVFSALASADDPDAARQMLSGRIHIGPEIDYLERAFDASKYGEFSRAPYLDVTIPSIADPSLAPEGQHVMSVYMQYAPYKLKNGGWSAQREELAGVVLGTLAAYAPNLPRLVLATQTITPQDLEETYGLTGGHIFHGELALDQLFTMRPLLDWARYRTPIRGLFLCGSGTHPGSGLTGASGANAAREIIHDLR